MMTDKPDLQKAMPTRSTPRQNRVDPKGALQAATAKGLLMGNRGQLRVRDDGRYVREWAIKPWIMCEIDLAKLGIIKPPPVKYTKLFFLDEATAFAAGHRPCGACRRVRLNEFSSAWLRANADRLNGKPANLDTLDETLHVERLASAKVSLVMAALSSLPRGTMVEHEGTILLVADGGLYAWSFDGYRVAPPLPGRTAVAVLTPPSVVAVYRQGFTPEWHSSADV